MFNPGVINMYLLMANIDTQSLITVAALHRHRELLINFRRASQNIIGDV